jgi:uncharacterized protein (TIGR03437 family)
LRAILVCCAVGALLTLSAAAQPAIATGGVVNASSELADIARGSWFVVKGTGLGPANIVVQNGAPFPATLSQTSITFTPATGGTAVNALMYYAWTSKSAAMLPSSTQAGDYDVRLTYNGQTSAPVRVKVVERNLGFATQASNGKGPAQATYGGYDLNRFTTGTLAQWSLRPAKPNDAMILWGTGLGADSASDANGGSSGDQTAAASVRVIVGGAEVTPAYAGRSNGSPGLDQINFVVPANVTPGCFVSIQVRAGGKLSNLGSIAVAGSGQTACSHPTLSAAQLSILDQGGSLTTGSISLTKSSQKITVPGFGSFDNSTESAGGWFSKITVDTLGSANISLLQIGACTIFQRTGTQDQVISGATTVTDLDAGSQLTLNGPNASSKAIPRQTDKTYTLSLYNSGYTVAGISVGGSGSPTIAQGSYTVAGTGGVDIGPFSATLSVPGTFTWANKDSVTDPISRSSSLPITWTGGTTGLVTIVGTTMAASGGTTQNPIYTATGFTCVSPASAGSFTVPSSVLSQLQAVSSDLTTGSFGSLAVYAVPDITSGQGSFTAPVVAGGNTIGAFFNYSIGSLKTTGYQ